MVADTFLMVLSFMLPLNCVLEFNRKAEQRFLTGRKEHRPRARRWLNLGRDCDE
jgi:hypothetical protein